MAWPRHFHSRGIDRSAAIPAAEQGIALAGGDLLLIGLNEKGAALKAAHTRGLFAITRKAAGSFQLSGSIVLSRKDWLGLRSRQKAEDRLGKG